MCGICGVCLDTAGATVDNATINAMNTLMTHRGPDGNGIHVDGHVGLGHCRLSIIDVAAGAQPMFNEDRSLAIVFNGEIYNYKEVRTQLQALGHVFRTQSDTEVILQAYREYGTACLDEFNGMFSFVLWDSRRNRLFGARDRLGEKPFYYCRSRNGLVFASELKSVLAGPGVDTEVDFEALDEYLSYGYVPAPRSIFRSVKKLPPAHYFILQDGNFSIQRYWQARHGEPSTRLPDEEYLRQFHELLSDSVRIRLRSDVPVGAFLSGGIDSSLIVALASGLRPTPLQTFSVAFNETDFDESPFAAEVAQRYGTEHNEIHVDDMNLSILPRLVAQFDEPFADPSAIPTYFVSREAARFVKVCLSGDAGDELFGGYSQYRWERLERTLNRIPAGLRESILSLAARQVPDHVRGVGWLRRMSKSGAIRYQRKIGIFDSIDRERLYRSDFQQYIDHDARLFAAHYADLPLDEIGRRMAIDQESYLPDDILVKVDRDSMLNSLEVRVPFLDHRIVEFANGLPRNLKIRGGIQKYVLKTLAKDFLPDSILSRPKQGFGLPLRHWLRNEHRDMAMDMLLSPTAVCHRYFQPSAIRQLMTSHMKGQRDHSNRIWALLWLEQWFQNLSSSRN